MSEIQRAEEVKFVFRSDSGIPGTSVLFGTHPDFPFPLIQVWLRWGVIHGSVEIVNSWVFSEMRRCGLRFRANDWLFEHFKVEMVERIVTHRGLPDGRKFMRAAGYTQAKDGHWFVTRAAHDWARRQRDAKAKRGAKRKRVA